MKRFSSYLLVGILGFSLSGLSESKKAAKAFKALKDDAYETIDDSVWLSSKMLYGDTEAYEKKIDELKKRPRKTANENRTDVPAIEKSLDFKSDFIELREKLIGNGKEGDKNEFGTKSAEDLNKVIEEYSAPARYNGLSSQAKFLALQLRGLKPLKSIIFRAKLYIGRFSAVRTMIVTMLRAQVSGIDTFFAPGPRGAPNHWDIVFDYLTEPVTGMGPEILSDEQLQYFLGQLAAESGKLVDELGELVKKKENIWWDNRLFMSYGNFASERDHYVMLGEAELQGIYAVAAANMSALSSTTAYQIIGLQKALKDIGELYGVIDLESASSAARSETGVDGMSSMSRIHVFKKYPQLGAIHPKGRERMKAAYKYLKDAVRAANLSYKDLVENDPKARRNSDEPLTANNGAFLDPNAVMPFSRIISTSLRNLQNAVADDNKEGSVTSSIVNGDVIRVNLSAFYNSPPAHLNELYPTAFVDTDREKDLKDNKILKDLKYRGTVQRNYRYGKSIEWSSEPFEKVFPDIKSYDAPAGSKDRRKRTKDIPRYVRVISQTWGASLFAIPMSALVF